MLDSKGIKLYIQASSQELKEEWLSAICYALTQESLESRLEDLLIKERNSIQFQLPSPDIYKYELFGLSRFATDHSTAVWSRFIQLNTVGHVIIRNLHTFLLIITVVCLQVILQLE